MLGEVTSTASNGAVGRLRTLRSLRRVTNRSGCTTVSAARTTSNGAKSTRRSSGHDRRKIR